MSEATFEFALMLDSQRWSGPAYPFGVRSELIKLLKYLGVWEPWRPRPTPRWTVRVYGLTWTFDQYMNSEMLAAQIHSHHRFVKGTSHWWCLYCNPDRGGEITDLGALEAADDFMEVVQPGR